MHHEHLQRQLTRRQAIKAGGIAALGLVFSKPVINTLRPAPVFAQVSPGPGANPYPTPIGGFEMAGIAWLTNGGSFVFEMSDIGILQNLATLVLQAPTAGVALIQANIANNSIPLSNNTFEIGIGLDSGSFLVSHTRAEHVPNVVVSAVVPVSQGDNTFYLNVLTTRANSVVELTVQSFYAIFFQNDLTG
jgi:hypothetical protein